MNMSKQYRSEALGAIHESMEALHQIGAISKTTMREFDEACLEPVKPLTPEDIRALREREMFPRTLFLTGSVANESQEVPP